MLRIAARTLSLFEAEADMWRSLSRALVEPEHEQLIKRRVRRGAIASRTDRLIDFVRDGGGEVSHRG